MNALLIDLDGVIYNGDSPIAGAAKTIEWIQHNDIPYLFLTNTTSKPRGVICAKLKQFNILVEKDRILTPPIVASSWIKKQVTGKAALVVKEPTKTDFCGIQIANNLSDPNIEAIVIGDMGAEWNFSLLNQIFRLLMRNPTPQLLALGMTRYWKAPDGLRLDVAPFVKALEYASSSKAKVLGKPSSLFFETALNLLGSTPSQTYMIGDDIFGDIEGAQKCGIKGVFVRTGKYREEDLTKGISPYAVIDSIASLDKLLSS